MAKSVVIVGGGVVGLCAAYFARQRGHTVTVVERGGPDERDGCSLGNAGMVVPSHFIPLAAPGMVGLGLRMLLRPAGPFAIRPRLDRDLVRWGQLFCRTANAGHVARAAPLLRDLNLASRELFVRFAETLDDDFGLTRRGLLMLCKTQRALDEETRAAQMARELGLDAEVMTPAAAQQLDPDGPRLDIAGAVYFPQDAHLSPGRFVAALTRAVTQAGVTLCWNTEVVGWRVGKSGRIEAAQTAEGEIAGDEIAGDAFVLASGAWSAHTVRDLGLDLPLQAGKGYSVTLPRPQRLPALCAILVEARVAVTPMDGELRFAGTMEVGGLDRTVNRRRAGGIFAAIPRYLPDFKATDFSDLPVWAGLRPCSPDGLPYVGRFRRVPNLCAATGHAMMGVSLAPITGRLVAEIVSDAPPALPLDALSPDRFAAS